MISSELRNVTTATARKTALLVSGVLILIGAWNGYRGRLEVAAVLGALALTLTAIGLFAPGPARRFHIVWMQVAGVLGYVNSRILLSVTYFGAFMPIGLATRLAGRDPLNRRAAPAETYWIRRKSLRQTHEGFERSF